MQNDLAQRAIVTAFTRRMFASIQLRGACVELRRERLRTSVNVSLCKSIGSHWPAAALAIIW
jgi:hypothetical protein